MHASRTLDSPRDLAVSAAMLKLALPSGWQEMWSTTPSRGWLPSCACRSSAEIAAPAMRATALTSCRAVSDAARGFLLGNGALSKSPRLVGNCLHQLLKSGIAALYFCCRLGQPSMAICSLRRCSPLTMKEDCDARVKPVRLYAASVWVWTKATILS